MRRRIAAASVVCACGLAVACARGNGAANVANGYVEATTVRVSSKIAGRLAEVVAVEGARVEAGAVVATVVTTDLDFALQRARADRDQASAMLQLLLAGSRIEDIQQAEAQAATAVSERVAVEAELASARADEVRFEQLVQKNAGSIKQRDDAVTRRQLAEARLRAAGDRIAAAKSAIDRLKAGARPEEVSAARARVQSATAQMDALEDNRREAVIKAPIAGIVSSRLAEPGEMVAVGTPIVLIVDLDRAWASVYVQEPLVPRLRIDQPATVMTDAGDRLEGRVTFVSPKAEFTPRNVQTPDERAKLVYRVKVSVDNRRGILKPGMPVMVDLGSGGQ
jgi:HlyD family secretion protein